MNKETTLNQSVNVLQQSDKIENRSMSCKEENSDLSKKRKHVKLETPRYIFTNTRYVTGQVRKVMSSLDGDDLKKHAIQIKDVITLLPGRLKQHHCFAYIFCYARELLKYFKLEDLRCFLDFMITIRLDFFTKKIMIRENNSNNTKKRYHAKSLTKSTREDLLKRTRNKKSRINTTKQQEELRKRRKKLKMELSYILTLFNQGCLKMIFAMKRLMM